jgi:TatD DNase family protein
MGLIDTHAHLCDASFDGVCGEVVARARQVGVEAIVAVGEDLVDARKNLDLSGEFPGVILPAAGLFPTNLDLAAADELIAFVRDTPDRWVAIGEVGLDHWKVKDEKQRQIQRGIFGQFIDLARTLTLVLNVHSRAAGNATIEFLLEKGAEKVQLHAFDGRASRAQPALEAGYYFSIPPSIVRSRQKQKLVRQLPLSCLLVETDSPVLGPDPRIPNEPANAVVAARAIAEIKGLSEEEVSEAVEENTRSLYGDLTISAG